MRVQPEEIEIRDGSYVRLDEPTLADAARRLKRLEALRDRIADPQGQG